MGLSGMSDRCNVLVTRHPVTDENSWHPRVLAHRSDSEEGGRKWRREFEMARPTTTPGAPDTGQGARPPGQPPTPKCLFPLDAKNGTEVAPVEPDVLADGLLGADGPLSVLATTYTEQEARECLSPTVVRDVQALQRARVAGWLTTCEFEEELLKLFTQCGAAAALTFTTPSPAGCTSGGLGALGATAPARGAESLCDPSPIPLHDVPGAQVPTTSTTAHPVDQVRKWEDVTIETLPESLTRQGPSRGLCPAQGSRTGDRFRAWGASKLGC